MNNNICQIIVSYNSKEILIDIDPYEDEVYNTFIKILAEKTGEQNILINYKLMCINSNIPYLLIDENNFWNILHEERKGKKLKLFMNKLEKNEEDDFGEEAFLGGVKAYNDNEFDDDFNEDFENKDKLSLEKEVNNKVNQEEIIQKEEIEKLEEMDNNKNSINNNYENIEKNENIKNKDNKNAISNNNNIDIKKEEIINYNTNKKVDNIIDEISINNKKNNNNLLNNTFDKESCFFCEKILNNIKYICIICNNMVLCNSCGENHDHPCFIYKTPFISSLKETFNFINKNYLFSTNTFSKKSQRNISVFLMGDKNISLRPNKGILIPLKIKNNSNEEINSSEFIIIVKGNKYLKISYDLSKKFKVLENSFYIIKLKCITPNKLCKEKIHIELFSHQYILKENNNQNIDLEIEINEDKDEEDLNYKLFFNEMAILYNKEHKNILISLIEKELKEYDVDDVIELVINFNWDIKKVLDYIKNLQEES